MENGGLPENISDNGTVLNRNTSDVSKSDGKRKSVECKQEKSDLLGVEAGENKISTGKSKATNSTYDTSCSGEIEGDFSEESVNNKCSRGTIEENGISAASSRAFFQVKENLKKHNESIRANQTTNKIQAPYMIEEVMNKSFTLIEDKDALIECAKLILSDVHDKSKLIGKTDKLKQYIEQNSNNHLYEFMVNKFKEIHKTLEPSHQADLKSSRRPEADLFPILLFDRLVSLYRVVVYTKGIWQFTEEESKNIASRTDCLSVEIFEFQRRLSKLIKNRQRYAEAVDKIEQKSYMGLPELNEVIGKIISEVVSNIKSGLIVQGVGFLHSGLGEEKCEIHPLVSNIVTLYDIPRKSPTSPSTHNVVTKQKSSKTNLVTVEKLNAPAGSIGNQSMVCGAFVEKEMASAVKTPSPRDCVEPFIQTVSLIDSSAICLKLFSSKEMQNGFIAMQGIRKGLEEFSTQRAFEFQSILLQQELLPSSRVPMPSDLLLHDEQDNRSSRQVRAAKIKDLEHLNNFQNSNQSTALQQIQGFLKFKFLELSRATLALFGYIGTVVRGIYEDIRVQNELATVSILSWYLSLVGFIFYNDLVELSNWMSPILSNVRRKIKQLATPVNIDAKIHEQTQLELNGVEQNSLIEEDKDDLKSNPFSETDLISNFNSSAEPLISILSNPSNICLSRIIEADDVLSLFLPHLKKSSKSTSCPVPLADRINQILVWLAWEGDLLTLYRSLRETICTPSRVMAQMTEQSNPSDGCKNYFNATDAKSNPKATDGSDSLSDLSGLVEDAIVNCVLNGYQAVKEKFSEGALTIFGSSGSFPDASHSFSSVTSSVANENANAHSPRNGITNVSASVAPNSAFTKKRSSLLCRGEDILDFCSRISEALAIRFLGEVDIKLPATGIAGGKSVPWLKKPLLCSLAGLKRSQRNNAGNNQIVFKVVEGSVKLIGEFYHQSLFYRCPLHNLELVSSEKLSANDIYASVASLMANSVRFSGLLSDLDLRLTEAKKLGEISLFNTHYSYDFLRQVDKRERDLEETVNMTNKGAIERLSNQAKNHFGRLEEHKTELTRLRGLTNSHQNLLTNHISDMKKYQEYSSESKNQLQKYSHLNDIIPNLESGLEKVNTLKEWVDKKLSEFSERKNEEIEVLLMECKSACRALRHETQEFLKKEAETKNAISSAPAASIKQEKKEQLVESLTSEFRENVKIISNLDEKVNQLMHKTEKLEERYKNYVPQSEEQNFETLKNSFLKILEDSIPNLASRVFHLNHSIFLQFLSVNMSQCISAHVRFELDKQDKPKRKPRRGILNWNNPQEDKEESPKFQFISPSFKTGNSIFIDKTLFDNNQLFETDNLSSTVSLASDNTSRKEQLENFPVAGDPKVWYNPQESRSIPYTDPLSFSNTSLK